MTVALSDIQNLEKSISESRLQLRRQFRVVASQASYDQSENFQSLIRSTIELGTSLTELSELLSVAPSTVSRWANGKAVPARYARSVIAKKIIDNNANLEQSSGMVV